MTTSISAEQAVQIWTEGICGSNRIVGVANEALFALVFLTGLRIRDISRVRWTHFSEETETLHYFRRSSGRHVHQLPPRAVAILHALRPRNLHVAAEIFMPRGASEIGGRREQWGRVRQRAGLPQMELRELRSVRAKMIPADPHHPGSAWRPFSYWANEHAPSLASIFNGPQIKPAADEN